MVQFAIDSSAKISDQRDGNLRYSRRSSTHDHEPPAPATAHDKWILATLLCGRNFSSHSQSARRGLLISSSSEPHRKNKREITELSRSNGAAAAVDAATLSSQLIELHSTARQPVCITNVLKLMRTNPTTSERRLIPFMQQCSLQHPAVSGQDEWVIFR